MSQGTIGKRRSNALLSFNPKTWPARKNEKKKEKTKQGIFDVRRPPTYQPVLSIETLNPST